MKFGLDKLQLFRCFIIFPFSLPNLIGLGSGRVPGRLLGCMDQLLLAKENEDNKIIYGWRKFSHIPSYSFGRMSSTLLNLLKPSGNFTYHQV
jgi:hypothetical protein